MPAEVNSGTIWPRLCFIIRAELRSRRGTGKPSSLTRSRCAILDAYRCALPCGFLLQFEAGANRDSNIHPWARTALQCAIPRQAADDCCRAYFVRRRMREGISAQSAGGKNSGIANSNIGNGKWDGGGNAHGRIHDRAERIRVCEFALQRAEAFIG